MKEKTMSQLLVKGIDYMTEEYVKQLIMDVTSDKLQGLRPYVDTIRFPSFQFTVGENSYSPTVQFGASMYIGYMDFLLPPAIASTTGTMAYTKLTFILDGMERTFVQLTGGDTENGASVKFSTYVQSLFPDANLEIPYNHNAIHILKDIKLEGSEFELDEGGNFSPVGFTGGAHTPNYRFQISCSGYVALIL